MYGDYTANTYKELILFEFKLNSRHVSYCEKIFPRKECLDIKFR